MVLRVKLTSGKQGHTVFKHCPRCKVAIQSGQCVVSRSGHAGKGVKAHRGGGLGARFSGMLGTPGSWQKEGGGCNSG